MLNSLARNKMFFTKNREPLFIVSLQPLLILRAIYSGKPEILDEMNVPNSYTFLPLLLLLSTQNVLLFPTLYFPPLPCWLNSSQISKLRGNTASPLWLSLISTLQSESCTLPVFPQTNSVRDPATWHYELCNHCENLKDGTSIWNSVWHRGEISQC